MIMLYVQLNAVDYSSLNVSWRLLNPQEEKFIDKIQIRYKKAEQDENEWQLTQVLHRDVRSYVLHDLHPGVSYEVNFVFNSNPDIPIHILSTKPIVIDMPSEPKDESMELSHAFRVPKENGKLILDGLELNKR